MRWINARRRRARHKAEDGRRQRDLERALESTPADQSELFVDVERFCLFVGCNRSGSSLTGSLLNAHREAVVAHELNVLFALRAGFGRDELFRLLMWKDAEYGATQRTGPSYSYSVPGQWHGRVERLRVIGDKATSAATDRLERDPRAIDQLEETAGVPVHCVQVIRNPFDVIATMAYRNSHSTERAATRWVRRMEVCSELRERTPTGQWHEVRHEDLVADPSARLTELCHGLALDAPADYVDACAGIVFPSSRRTRDTMPWTAATIALVRRTIDTTEFLAGYTDEPPPAVS